MNDADFDAAVAGFHRAARGQLAWGEALAPIRAAFGAAAAVLMGMAKDSGAIAFSYECGTLPEAASLDYLRSYHSIDVRAALVLDRPVGECVRCCDYYDEAFVAANAFYQDFLIPYGVRHVAGAKAYEDNRLLVVLGVQIAVGAAPVSDAGMRLLARLVAQLTVALHVYCAARGQRGEPGVGAALLDRLRAPAFVVDELRRLHYANPAGRQWLAAPGGLGLIDGRLVAARRQDDADFTLALRQLKLDGERSYLGAGAGRERSQLRLSSHEVVFLHAVRPDDTMAAFGTRPLALMLAHDLGAGIALDPFVVAETFGLTPAEARIAVGLAAGSSVEEIAAERCVSLATVRSQLAAAMHKMGVHRQPELVARLAALPSAGFVPDDRRPDD
ncbi:helix-turn-helix transcriptional regulator [Derxia lacustris]|uniref:helix-turn-helix transcriptional regulator n=1 Tax=Derxia lacustris TaxID=764842 RepID=UPI000A16F5D2|nr:helix-turn-helix transcriptional regulator [Derxia lacustris]